MPQFAREVRGRLIEFRKLHHLKLRVARDGCTLKIANPAGLQNPGVLLWFPGSARSVDAAAQRKILRVELKDAQAAEEDAVGVEELIVINLRVIAEDPAVLWLEIR